MQESSTFPHHGEAERWLPVVGWEGLYEVSDLGRVRSLPRQTQTGLRGGQVLKPRPDADGYLLVNLSRAGIKTTKKVHQLVAEAFLGPCPPGQEVCHNRPNSRDCAEATNLRYGTRSQNIQQAVQEGTHWTGRNEDDACGVCGTLFITNPSGRRRCPRCEAKRWAEYYERNREALHAKEQAGRAEKRAARASKPKKPEGFRRCTLYGDADGTWELLQSLDPAQVPASNLGDLRRLCDATTAIRVLYEKIPGAGTTGEAAQYPAQAMIARLTGMAQTTVSLHVRNRGKVPMLSNEGWRAVARLLHAWTEWPDSPRDHAVITEFLATGDQIKAEKVAA